MDNINLPLYSYDYFRDLERVAQFEGLSNCLPSRRMLGGPVRTRATAASNSDMVRAIIAVRPSITVSRSAPGGLSSTKSSSMGHQPS